MGLRKVINRVESLPGVTKDLPFILVLLLLSIVFFANVLFTDDVLVGDNLARDHPWRSYASEELLQKPTNGAGDPLGSYYPEKLIAARIVRGKDLPLWNPYYLAGVPFLATEPKAGFFYPLNVIYYVIGPLEAFGLSACLHLFLAGVFMYVYLRSIELSRFDSLFGALCFAFGGYFLMNLMWLPRVNVGIWAPLLFACFEWYWRRRRRLYLVLLAFAVGLCLLAGHPIVFVFIMLGFALHLAFRVVLALRERRDGPVEIVKSAIAIVAAVVVGVLLSAVQLIPTFEAGRFAERARMPYEDRLDTGRSVVSLATAIIPDVFGNPVDAATPSWAYEQFGEGVPTNYASPNMYGGVLTLTLGILALTGERKKYSLFFAALALISVSIFLDAPSAVFRFLYLFPVFRVGRQVEVKVLYGFAIAVLAALGFASLSHNIGDGRGPVVQRAGVALLVLGAAIVAVVGIDMVVDYSTVIGGFGFSLEWYRYNVPNFLRFALLLLACSGLLVLRARNNVGPHLFATLAIALVVVDMFYFGWKFNPPQDPQDFLFETDGIRFLRADEDIFRIIRGPGGRNTLPPNTPAVFGISDAQGYTNVLLDYYADFMNLIEDDISGTVAVHSLGEVSSLDSKLLDLLNVKYILTRPMGTEELGGFDLVDGSIQLVYNEEMKIYQNKDALPRAFAVADFKVIRTKEEILAELASEDFDPASRVILEEEPEMDRASMALSPRGSSAEILQYGPNKVTIEAEMGSDGFLVLSDLYYEGWKAFVDAEESRVYKADYAFRAVQLTQGRHIIEFVFDPLTFKIGLCISTLTLLALVVLLIWDAFKTRSAFLLM